jgi:hypothetical protein
MQRVSASLLTALSAVSFNSRLQTDVAPVNICLASELWRCQASPGASLLTGNVVVGSTRLKRKIVGQTFGVGLTWGWVALRC